MVAVYVSLILMKKMTLEDVPEIWKEAVATALQNR